MSADESTASHRDDRASALRTAIETACRSLDQAPSFSSDGGVTVYDQYGRAGRVQPLGQRTRLSLTADDGSEAEGEVDTDTLIEAIGRHRSAYGALEAALDRENALRSAVE